MNKNKLYCEYCQAFRDYTILNGDQKIMVGGIGIVVHQKVPICNICGCETASSMELFKYNCNQSHNAYQIKNSEILAKNPEI